MKNKIRAALVSAAALALIVGPGLSSCSKPAEQNAAEQNAAEPAATEPAAGRAGRGAGPMRARRMRRPCSRPCRTISRRRRPYR